MAIVEIISDAKCKHCKHFKRVNLTKKDGTPSKVVRHYCGIPNRSGRTWNLTLKDKVCRNGSYEFKY